MRNPRILLYLALLLAIANIIAHIDAPPRLPLVRADFSTCELHNPNGPVVPPKAELNGMRRTKSEIT